MLDDIKYCIEVLLDLIIEYRLARVCCSLEWLLDQRVYPISCVDFMLGTLQIYVEEHLIVRF